MIPLGLRVPICSRNRSLSLCLVWPSYIFLHEVQVKQLIRWASIPVKWSLTVTVTNHVVGYKTSLLSARDNVTTFVIMVYTMCSRFIACYQEFLFQSPRSKQSVSTTFVSVTSFQSFSLFISVFCIFCSRTVRSRTARSS